MARVANLFDLVSVPWAAAHIALGCLGGLLVVWVGTTWRRRSEPDEVEVARVPVPIKPIVGVAPKLRRARTRRGAARDTARDSDVLLPTRRRSRRVLDLLRRLRRSPDDGKTPKDLAVVRVGSTLFGVVALAVASLILLGKVLFSLGVIILFGGIGLSPAYPIVGGGLTSFGSILLAGAPTGDVTGWAVNRLLDTIAGCAIALVSTYLLWPRDRETAETVPVPAAT
jgi:hypothetical protein